MKSLALPVVALALSLAVGQVPALTAGEDSRSGEFFEYEVHWAGMLVGRVNVYNHGMTTRADRPCQKLEAYARTDGPIETLYEAKMRYLGFLHPDSSSWLYEEWEKDKDWRLQEWLEFPDGLSVVKRFQKR